MQDRFDEFQKRISKKQKEDLLASTDIIIPDNTRKEIVEFIEDFLKNVEDINDKFAYIDQKILDIVDIQTAILEFSESDEKLHSFYKRIKSSLEEVAGKISDLENSFDVRKFYGSDAELRICTTQLFTLKRKITACVSNYYGVQEEYKNKCKARVKRQAQIIGVDLSKIDFDEAVESRTDLFLQTVLPDFNIAYHYLHEIKKRHEQFLHLEESVKELHDLFFDLALVVQIDYALIDRIDQHSHVINKLLEEAVEDFKDATRKRRTLNFRNWVICICCSSLIVIIILSVLTAVR